MIYCVVPPELADELLPQLEAYYADDPDVEVIVDRRSAERRARGAEAPEDTQREVRDRRRTRIPGDLPDV
ncbi:MAG: hypothetical protein H0V81_10535 [Solirubrobacterales bacterium]|nr:hypothetical protein [Solirubrobacterales bacterium]